MTVAGFSVIALKPACAGFQAGPESVVWFRMLPGPVAVAFSAEKKRIGLGPRCDLRNRLEAIRPWRTSIVRLVESEPPEFGIPEESRLQGCEILRSRLRGSFVPNLLVKSKMTRLCGLPPSLYSD